MKPLATLATAAVLMCGPALAADPATPMKAVPTKPASAAPAAKPAGAARTKPTLPEGPGESQLFTAPPAQAAANGTYERPSVETCRRMATETLLAFNQALQRKTFAAFHVGVARPFAEQTSADALTETFRPFIDNEANVAGVEHVEPIFDPEPLVQGDVLKVTGFYPTRPMRVLFDFDYLADGGRWKLAALTVTLKGSPAAPGVAAAGAVPPGVVAPGAAQLNKLVTDTLLEFDRGVKRKDFASLLANASTPMKWQTKPAQLKEAFATFLENGTDISAIADAEPQFDGRPVFKDKTMAVSGHYRVLPLFVMFQLDYYYEANQWKLLAIGVNTLAPAEAKRNAAIKGETGRSDGAAGADGERDESAPDKPGGDAAGDGDAAPAMKSMDKRPAGDGGARGGRAGEGVMKNRAMER